VASLGVSVMGMIQQYSKLNKDMLLILSVPMSALSLPPDWDEISEHLIIAAPSIGDLYRPNTDIMIPSTQEHGFCNSQGSSPATTAQNQLSQKILIDNFSDLPKTFMEMFRANDARWHCFLARIEFVSPDERESIFKRHIEPLLPFAHLIDWRSVRPQMCK
jgi:hypothetical protein